MSVAGLLMAAVALGIPLSAVVVVVVLAAEVLVVATKAMMRYSFDCQAPFSVNLVPDCLWETPLGCAL